MKRALSVLLVTLFVLSCAVAVAQEGPGPGKKPAILFCCPGENRYDYVGYDYMQALEQAGFVVDYIEGAKDLTWDKVKNYNVLFVYDFPARGPDAEAMSTSLAMRPPWLADYWAVLDRFVKAGGGVFLHYWPFWGGAAPNDLLQQWGLQFPLLWLRDTLVQQMTNMPSGLAYTDQIADTPVSKDVRGFWYPYDSHYFGQHTMPILVDADWQVVARPSQAAYTVVPKFGPGEAQPSKDALIPGEPVKDPVLFAIRDYAGGGRLATVQTWFNFSVGSGMKWLYNDEVLTKGLGTRPSDYGKLLTNTYRWLAEPSLKSGAVGGAVQDQNRLREPMLRAGAMDEFHDWYYEEDEVLEYHHPPVAGQLYRGLIGAQTALSGGTGSVADYAQAAAELKLDFIVFLEDLAQMTPEKLERLKDAVARNSTPTLKLIAGYRMKVNTGNYAFLCGENPVWPEERMLTGPDKRTMNWQFQNEKGEWAKGNPALDWWYNVAFPKGNNLGYYNFTKSGDGMKMYDLRVYSMVALRTYEGGKLVEDMTADYLTTCQATSVPTPVSLNLVKSPAEMRAAVASNQALTYGLARSLDLVWQDALRWTTSYEAPNAFPSDGPLIEAWPKCNRVMTFGSENFVSGRSLTPSPIRVTASTGLKEIRIYDGERLFRRFLCGGTKEFVTTLFFPGTVQRNLVLIAEDAKGGVATSFAYRQYKEGGSFVPVFCGDHTNDCAYMLLARGPHWPNLFMTPRVPQAGGTWDGGPTAVRALVSPQYTYPAVYTDQGNYEEPVPYQVPRLEFADEGASRCRMDSTRTTVEGVPIINPWHTCGPLRPSPIVDLSVSHTYFDQYVTGVEPNNYGAPGVREGPIASLFTERLTYKQDCTPTQIRLFHSWWRGKTAPRSTILVMGKGTQLLDMWDLTDTPPQIKRARIDTGGWFALFSSQVANTHLFLNRGKPLLMEAHPYTWYWLNLYADLDQTPVKKGDTYDAEIFVQAWPLDQAMTDAKSIADMVAYLESPTGMEITRGRQAPGPGGLLELTPENYAVELSIPKPAGVTRTVPLRVGGLNHRWSVGLYQFEGYRTHYYSKGDSGWRALGLDFEGRAYAPLFVSKAANTHVMIGHPVVADAAGKDLFIQVTRINDGLEGKPPAWHLSVNNPTNQPVTATLQRAMEVPGLAFTQETMTLAPGEYKVFANK